MADNFAFTEGSGKTGAADEVGSVLYPRVKVVWGPDGTVNDADVASGKPLPVQIRGSAGGDVVKLEDGASADADPGVPILVTRKATPANTSGTDGDYEFLQMSAGRLWTNTLLGDGTNAVAVKAASTAAQAADPALVVAISPNGQNSNGQAAMADSAPVVIASDQAAVEVKGGVAHDGADSGNPHKIGMKAIAHGTNPTAVAANDRTDLYANRHGIPWMIGGHPNIITRSHKITDADGAQTNFILTWPGSLSSGSKIVVTQISATCDAANSGNVAVRIGFGVGSLSAAALSGVSGILLEGKFGAGGGHQKGSGAGILGIGADGEDLLLTCDDPAGGALYVTYSYYTIES